MNEPVGNDLLGEFHIETQDLSREERVAIIREIYNKILCKDDRWHFFYEEEQGDIIRCSPQFFNEVKDWLVKHYIGFKSNGSWIETISEVINNPEYFADLFHLNSIFIINDALHFDLSNKRLSMAMFIDRYSHSLYLKDAFVSGNTKFSEGIMLCETLLGRAFYEGMRHQYLKDKPFLRVKDD